MTKENNNQLFKDTMSVSDMFREWYIDYASYVILERAIPRFEDGLKPVQRRILHALNKMDDGRFHKVANVIGQTMQYHPHGDSAINDALVSIGQKELLIETQGNWGDYRTGDKSAAARYIETRLSEFSKEIAFNNDITNWLDSYDGRNKEPEVLPVKFPILLFQGTEGIAVGLSTKILPHNFNEIVKAMILYLKGRSFFLYPDFKTGGLIDVDLYNKGKRGGKIRARAVIDVIDKNTLIIKNVPYGVTTLSLIESIVKANEKGKIKIKSIDDNTAENVEIVINLVKGISPSITIDALYAFTNCEISISPNCCVIIDKLPQFISINKLLKLSTDYSISIFKLELQYLLDKLLDKWHQQTLEIIFISNKIYRKIENLSTWKSILDTVKKSMRKHRKLLKKDISDEDVVRLTELKIKKISKYDLSKALESVDSIESNIKDVRHDLDNLIDHAILYYEKILKRFGDKHQRRSIIEKFDNISARSVAIANKKLYVNRKDGFIGYDIKNNELVSDCSELDNIIVFLRDGRYIVTQIESKKYIGNEILHVAIWRKNDEHMVYNYVYKDSISGWSYVKRFSIKSAIKDRFYSLTRNEDASSALYITANPNSESEIISIDLDINTKARVKNLTYDFSKLDIKNKNSKGNILTKYKIKKINQSSKGESTLGGKDLWIDESIGKLNYEQRGKYLGKFDSNDLLLHINNDGEYFLLGMDLNLRFKQSETALLTKFNSDIIVSCMYQDGPSKDYYIKRFNIKTSTIGKEFKFINASKATKLILVDIHDNAVFRFNYFSKSGIKKEKSIDVNNFVMVKGWKSIGNKISKYKRMSGFIVSDQLISTQDTENNDKPNDVGDTLNLFE